MDIMINESKVVWHAMEDAIRHSLSDEDTEKVLTIIRLQEESAANLIRVLNEAMAKTGYTTKIKSVFERLGDNLASRIDVKVTPESINLEKGATEYINIELMNRFDVPLVFEVNVEDRDSFLPIVYNKIEDSYFNGFSQEGIIDSGDMGKFRFKVGSPSEQKAKDTVLFVVVRSRDIEGLNKVGKIKVLFT